MNKFNQGDQVTIISSGQTVMVDGNNTIGGEEKVECGWMDGDIWKKAFYFEKELMFRYKIENCKNDPPNFSLGEIVKVKLTGQSVMVIRYLEVLGKDQIECDWWEGDIKESACFSENELTKIN